MGTMNLDKTSSAESAEVSKLIYEENLSQKKQIGKKLQWVLNALDKVVTSSASVYMPDKTE